MAHAGEAKHRHFPAELGDVHVACRFAPDLAPQQALRVGARQHLARRGLLVEAHRHLRRGTDEVERAGERRLAHPTGDHQAGVQPDARLEGDAALGFGLRAAALHLGDDIESRAGRAPRIVLVRLRVAEDQECPVADGAGQGPAASRKAAQRRFSVAAVELTIV